MGVEAPPEPRKIEKVAGAALRITWGDRHVSTFPWSYLRRECPCANCGDEGGGKAKVRHRRRSPAAPVPRARACERGAPHVPAATGRPAARYAPVGCDIR